MAIGEYSKYLKSKPVLISETQKLYDFQKVSQKDTFFYVSEIQTNGPDFRHYTKVSEMWKKFGFQTPCVSVNRLHNKFRFQTSSEIRGFKSDIQIGRWQIY